MNPSKDKGTHFETAIVAHLREQCGYLCAERRAQSGAKDRGDISGVPGLVIEAKNQRKLELAGWMRETEVERKNDGADVGVLVVKRKGKARAGDAYAVVSFETFMQLWSSARQWEAHEADEGIR